MTDLDQDLGKESAHKDKKPSGHKEVQNKLNSKYERTTKTTNILYNNIDPFARFLLLFLLLHTGLFLLK